MLSAHSVLAICLTDKGIANDIVWFEFAIETREGTANLRFYADTDSHAHRQLKAIAASLEPQGDHSTSETSGAPKPDEGKQTSD